MRALGTCVGAGGSHLMEGAGGSHLMEKLSLVSAVQDLWNKWEIPSMILVSLSLQVFLFLFAGMRQRSSWWPLRTVLWLAYLSADTVAVFVLGHLAVRASEPGHHLVSFWAPFLLVHLGGQDTITAFSKQDNELWLRHLLNLGSQAAVAGYVMAKVPWPDGRLTAAVVLMFLSGFLKYAERTAILGSADPVELQQWSTRFLSWRLRGKPDRKILLLGNTATSSATRDEAQKIVSATLVSIALSKGSSWPLYWDAVEVIPDTISVDAPLNREPNITIAEDDLAAMLDRFLSRDDRLNAYKHVATTLRHCYRRLYTKEHLRQSCIQPVENPLERTLLHTFFYFIAIFPCVSTSVALALFFMAAKTEDNLHATSTDIAMSYILLVGAIVLDVSSITIFTFSQARLRLPARIQELANWIQPPSYKKQWSEDLVQYNMINNVAGRLLLPKHPFFFILNKICAPATEVHVSSIKKFILDTLLESGTRKRWDISSTRGQLALDKCLLGHSAYSTRKTLEELKKIVRSGDFTTSLLIWHIATDMCYYFGGTNSDQVEKEKVNRGKQISIDLSNYITYIVFQCGVMRTNNSQIVHDNAVREISEILSQPLQVINLSQKDAVIKLYGEDIQFENDESEETQHLTGEIQIQDSTVEIQIQDSTVEIRIDMDSSADNANASDSNHMKKLQQNSETLKSPVLPRARQLAKDLISIKDEAARWDFIATVWAEMLFYIAPRCGGGFHYDRLSKGGEFVTHVLLLMYYLGPFLPPPDVIDN